MGMGCFTNIYCDGSVVMAYRLEKNKFKVDQIHKIFYDI